MSRSPKPFQVATAEAALRAFRDVDSSRRFLVADEVGLGKTVVARTIIQKMVERSRRPLVVFYVASNVTIAHQNRSRLLDFLPTAVRSAACAAADRLTLAANPALRPKQSSQLHLYTLTPDTSAPLYRRRGGTGRIDERAFIYKLIHQRFPRLRSKYFTEFCRGRAGTEGWKNAVALLGEIRGIRVIQRLFFGELMRDLPLNLKSLSSNNLESLIDDAVTKKKQTWLLSRFRNALAVTALSQINPDLIVFDEFQKFRDLLIDSSGVTADCVTLALRGARKGQKTALLLLSATPYRHYVSRKEEADGRSHHEEFFELIRFLFGEESSRPFEIEKDLVEFRALMLAREVDFSRLEVLRNSLETKMRPVMSRTERHHASVSGTKTPRKEMAAKIEAGDLRIFTHWVERLRRSDLPAARSRKLDLTSYALPYWFSIPLPAQMMNDEYVAWRHSHRGRQVGEICLTKADRNGLRALKPWPHPQIRALSELVPPERLSRPWLAPSLPWWRLKGLWGTKTFESAEVKATQPADGKVLVFSRFKAVPPTVSSLLSFGVESHLGNRLKSYDRAGDASPLQLTADSRAILALFFPSPTLIQNTDPRRGGTNEFSEIRTQVTAQVRGILNQYCIPVRRSGKARPLWQLLAGLEGERERVKGDHGVLWSVIRKHWCAVSGDAPGQRLLMRAHMEQWSEIAKAGLVEITMGELAILSDFAISGPGVVLGRALSRFIPEPLDDEIYAQLLDVTWNGLRPYLNRSWFKVALGGRRQRFVQSIREAVVDGNLESVLDEHFWISSRLDGDGITNALGELRKVFDLMNGRHRVHVPGGEEYTLRCHAAMPFADTTSERKGGSDRLRTDDLRRAFNSPFWPHVLATTSLGQEGLDFHVWCRHLLHWDLPHSPLDLEQREGRIQRYGGLSTRSLLAQKFHDTVLSGRNSRKSPWQTLSELAEEMSKDDSSGISPWWGSDNEAIETHIVKLHHSRHVIRFNELSRQRLFYRLALGQPHQQDFIEHVSKLPADGRDRYALRLAAWRNQSDTAG